MVSVTAGPESAAPGKVDGAWDIALKDDLVRFFLVLQLRYGGQQADRVGMHRMLIDLLIPHDFDNPSEIHDGDPMLMCFTTLRSWAMKR